MLNKKIVFETISKRISEIKRELSVLSTEESQLFFAGRAVDWMVAHSKLKGLQEELLSLEGQIQSISSKAI